MTYELIGDATLQSPSGTITNDLRRGTQLLIRSRDPNTTRQTHDAIARILSDAHIIPPDSWWRGTTFNADTQLALTGVLTISRWLTLLALILVSLMIFTTVSTLLSEQLPIIGTLKALGGMRWQIGGCYLLTVGMYSIVGTLMGDTYVRTGTHT